jgi:hypothetical protein
MAQRTEAKDSLDDFPTPPWATRALIEYIIKPEYDVSKMTCLEPACGRGYMSKVLDEYFQCTHGSDVASYNGSNKVIDFLGGSYQNSSYDWVITNPPFRLAEDFVLRALDVARLGVAILARTVFLESVGRYQSIFSINPPTKFAQFSERVPMVKGRVDEKATTATGYAWLIWQKNSSEHPRLTWLPPCRKKLERPGDYNNPECILPTTPSNITKTAAQNGELFLLK